MASVQSVGKDVEGSTLGLIWDFIPAFAQMNWVKWQKVSISIAGLQAKIRTEEKATHRCTYSLTNFISFHIVSTGRACTATLSLLWHVSNFCFLDRGNRPDGCPAWESAAAADGSADAGSVWSSYGIHSLILDYWYICWESTETQQFVQGL